jgi:hypothetical protein
MGDAGGLWERTFVRSRLESKRQPQPQAYQGPCFGTSVLVAYPRSWSLEW